MIDHLDIDRVAAETLVERAPVVVVNAAQSISGRYPNAGPAVLVEAGIPLLDAVGQAVFELHGGRPGRGRPRRRGPRRRRRGGQRRVAPARGRPQADGRGQGQPGHRPGGLHPQHPLLRPPRPRPAAGGAGDPDPADPAAGPARAGGGPRPRLQEGPVHPARLHPGVPAGPHRGRRRRRRPARGRPQARPDPGGHGLGHQRGAHLGGRDRRPRLPRRPRPRQGAGRGPGAGAAGPARAPGPARTWPCCSPTSPTAT